MFKSKEEKSTVMQGLSAMGHGAMYQFVPENASEQFRYWTATNMHNYKVMLFFFNIQNDNKLVKEGSKIILDKI